MKNIKGHKINIPSEIMEVCWDTYKNRYVNIETSIEANSSTFDYTKLVYPTGAIIVEQKTISHLIDSELTKFFFGKKRDERTVTVGRKYLLRGIEYYVGMVKDSNLSKTQVIFTNLKEYFQCYENCKPEDSYVLYLGLLDNIKNYLLIILYTVNQISRELGYTDEYILSIYQYNKFLALINVIEFSFIKTFFSGKIYKPAGVDNYMSIIDALFIYISKNIVTVEKNKKIKNKLIRKSRETDNTLKMIELAQKVSDEFIRQDTLLIGIEYGGIELPFIINAYREFIGKSRLNFITLNLSNYSNSSNLYVDSIKYSLSPYFLGGHLKSSSGVIILDDSVTTGRTIETVVQLLPYNIEEVFLACNSFKVSNRYHHLTRKDHGGLNPFVAENSIFRSLSNYANTYTKNSYTNKKGIFDKDKRKIEKLISSKYSHYITLDL